METKKLQLRIMKNVDAKYRVNLSVKIARLIKSKSVYVELYDDGSINIVPVVNKKGGK